VSRTSGSWTSSKPGPERIGGQVGLRGDRASRPTRPAPGDVGRGLEGALQVVLGAVAHVQIGMRWPPPELPADAPVALLAQPVEVALGVALGVDPHAARGHRVHRLLGQARRAVDVPIRTNHWSDRYGSIGVLLRSE
jgi:hypothetical protein